MNKSQDSFAERLRKGDLLIGTLVSLPSPEITEILARTGFDWLFIDTEHGPFNPQQALGMLQAAYPCPCLIRLPAGDDIWIKKALDIGAAGVIVPQVNTAEQAECIVNACKYSPEGSRGVGMGRAHQYGLAFEETINSANIKTAVILQAETRDAVNNIGKIVLVKGIDAILIGPYDLSASMGHIGEVTHPEVKSAIQEIADSCRKAHIRLGIFGVSPEAVKPYLDSGFTLITVGTDTLFVINSAKQILNECRG